MDGELTTIYCILCHHQSVCIWKRAPILALMSAVLLNFYLSCHYFMQNEPRVLLIGFFIYISATNLYNHKSNYEQIEIMTRIIDKEKDKICKQR